MEALKQSIREKGKMVVAFSGGVDSTFLLKVAHDVLGDGAVAVTARSCSFPERELREAKAFCEKIEYKNVRFRTLGCYPLTGGIESNATTLDEIIDETLSAVESERTTRVIDNEAAGSMERRKREGYF